MAQLQRNPRRLAQRSGTKRSNRGGKRLASVEKSPRKKVVLTVLGVLAEIATVVQLFLGFAPAGSAAAPNVNTVGGDATQIEQHIMAGDNAQIINQVGGETASEPTPEPTPGPVLDELSEEELARVRGMHGKDQMAHASDYYRAGEYRKAEQVLDILLEDEGHSQILKAAACYNLGLVRYRQGNFDMARQAFEDSTQAKESAQAYYCLGIVNYNLGKYEQAAKAYDQAIFYEASNTAKVDIYLARAAAYECWADAPEGKALEDYENAQKLAPENSDALAGVRRLGGSEG